MLINGMEEEDFDRSNQSAPLFPFFPLITADDQST